MQPPTTMLSSQSGRSLPLPCGSAHQPTFAAYQRWLKRLIDIVNPNAKTIDSLQRIELPAGVDIEIKIQNA